MSRKAEPPEAPQYKTDEILREEAVKRMKEREKLKATEKPVPAWKKKTENFWYHYKWHTVFGTVFAAILAFLLKDVLFTTKPDATIIMTTQTYYDTDTIAELTETLEACANDYNGDGKVYIIVDYIYSPSQSAGEKGLAADSGQMASNLGQQDYTSDIKLATVTAAGADPLYIIDDGMYEHFLQIAAGYDNNGNPMPISEDTASIFTALDEITGSEGKRLLLTDTVLADSPAGGRLEGLTFCLRQEASPSGSQNSYYAYCLELLKTLAE